MEHPQNSGEPEGASSSEPGQTEAKSNHHALMVVFLVIFIDLLGFGLVLPLLPRLAKDFIPGGESSGLISGLLMASFSAMQFIFAPIWGRISDRVGRRPILLLGLGTSVLFYALLGVGSEMGGINGLILLFVARIGAGMAGATIGTAQAAIADSTTPERRSRGMALIGAAFGIGFTFGPLIGFGALTFFPDWLGGPGYVAAGFSALAFLIGYAKLPETLKLEQDHRPRRWLNWEGFHLAWQTPYVGLLIVMFFLAVYSFASFEPTLALLTRTAGLKLDDSDNFLVFAYVGFALALAQGVLYRRLALRLKEITFIRSGALLTGLGLAGIGTASMLSEQQGIGSGGLIALLFVALAVAVTGFAFLTPSIHSLISRFSDPTRQGEILGVNQSVNALARIAGPATGLPLYYLTPDHLVPYTLGAVLLLIVFGMSFRIRQAGEEPPAV